jgi:DNA-directed RNA polymerase subunit RPC12/RpoP
MSTKVLCPHCGGLVYTPDGAGIGERLCVCAGKPPDPSHAKRCVACGKDVAHDRRMKDKEGNYWCLPCGLEDRKRRQQHGYECPDCKQKYPRDKMELFDGTMLCIGCAVLRRKTRQDLKKRLGIAGTAQHNRSALRIQIAIVTALILAVACAVYLLI